MMVLLAPLISLLHPMRLVFLLQPYLFPCGKLSTLLADPSLTNLAIALADPFLTNLAIACFTITSHP
jgi:hypothetical protein